jgi:DNA-binding CsgD family transcriptional regulator/PAS domain-containing protein
MILVRELSSLLETLYAAPLEPEQWQVFLERLCAFTNTASGCMVAVGADENAILAGAGFNFDPEILHLYNQHYGAIDPYVAPVKSIPRVGIIQAEALVSRTALVRSELYNDLLRRYDLEYMTVVSSDLFAEAADFFPLWRSPKHGPMDSDSRSLLEILLPHVQTALRLRRKVRDCNAAHLFSETALDAMSIAAILVTNAGRVRHMNQLAAAYLQAGDGLSIHNGCLAASESGKSAQLISLIYAAASSGRNGSQDAPGGAIKLRRLRTPGDLCVTVIPVPQDNQIAGMDSSALVFVWDPGSAPRPRTALLRQLYGLTPAEVRVANLLLEGAEVRETAERLNITLQTCRFHIKRVLTKTGRRRQMDLIRLMLSLPGV